jgi:dUTP pyrophosphatase
MDAGLDLCACEDVTIPAKGQCLIGTGLAWGGVFLCNEYEKPVMIIKSRSGLAVKHNIECSNAGVIDALYTGEIKVLLRNMSEAPFQIKAGERIAQGIIYMIPHVQPYWIEELPDTSRGINGFGSTGA